MKILRTCFLVAACLIGGFASAQDLIVKKDGTVIQAKVTKVSSVEVEYKKWSNPDGPLYTLAIADILAINYINGEKETFDNASTSSTASTPESGTRQVTIESLSPAEKAANEALIAKYNQNYDTNVGEIEKNDYTKWAFGRLGVTDNSVLENEDIAINMETGFLFSMSSKKRPELRSMFNNSSGISHANVGISFSISNKTNNTLFVDLGNTFYVSMGEFYAYYVPSSTTTTSGSSSGIGINAGAIAGALGVGGGLGTLASGVNIGGGKSSGTSTTTYSQRVIAIPPHATYTLDPKFIFGEYFVTSCPGFFIFTGDNRLGLCVVNFCEENGGRMQDYDHYSYSVQSLPLQLSFVTVYSRTEDFRSSSSMHVGLYLKEIYGQELFRTMMETGKVPTIVERKSRPGIDKSVLAFKLKVENYKKQPSFPKQ